MVFLYLFSRPEEVKRILLVEMKKLWRECFSAQLDI